MSERRGLLDDAIASDQSDDEDTFHVREETHGRGGGTASGVWSPRSAQFNHDESDDEPIFGAETDTVVVGSGLPLDENGLASTVEPETLSLKHTYDDFTTIDWVRDQVREQERLRANHYRRPTTFRLRLWSSFDAIQGWIVVLLVGLAAGVLAGVLDVSVDWLSNVKMGVCRGGFWLTKRDCCWAEVSEDSPESVCHSWLYWSEVFSGKSGIDVGLSDNATASTYVINYVFYVLISVMLAAASALIVRDYSVYASGSGIPEVKTILGGFVIRRYLGLWTLVTKLVGASLSVASGLSLGKEGPMVHMCSCVGNIVSRLFPKYRDNEAKKREVVSAASAAGVSVAFGAPIGGVLFSLEEISYYFPHKTMWRSFFCALVAAATLMYLDPFRTGRLVLFDVTTGDNPWYFFEMPAFLLLGIFGGLFGAAFNAANTRWCAYKQGTRIRAYPIGEVVVVALVTALVNYANPYQRGQASELILELFNNCPKDSDGGVDAGGDLCDSAKNFGSALWLLALVALFKMVITVFTYGIRVPAGLFVPSMTIGACVGRITGVLMWQLVHRHSSLAERVCPADTTIPCVSPGLYALVGASAALGGILRLQVALVVVLFELTGSLSDILPIMVAVVSAKWVGDFFSREGIYDAHIRLNAYPYLDNKIAFEHTTLAVDAMRPQRGDPPLSVIALDEHKTVHHLQSLLHDNDYVVSGWPVVVSRESMTLVGYVARSELKAALAHAQLRYETQHREQGHQDSLVLTSVSATGALSGQSAFNLYRCYFGLRVPSLSTSDYVHLRSCLDDSPLQVTESTPMVVVVDMFRKMGLRHAIVGRSGQIVGIITKKDVIRHMEQMDEGGAEHVLFR